MWNRCTASTNAYRLIVVLFSLVIPTGCGSSETRVEVHPVNGSVAVAGSPAENVRLTFYPQSKEHQEASVFPRAVSAADGKFVLSTYEPADGIPVGEYVVTASWKEQPTSDASEIHPDELSLVEEKLAERYTDPELSPLKVTIQAGANKLPQFDLSLAETKKQKYRK